MKSYGDSLNHATWGKKYREHWIWASKVVQVGLNEPIIRNMEVGNAEGGVKYIRIDQEFLE